MILEMNIRYQFFSYSPEILEIEKELNEYTKRNTIVDGGVLFGTGGNMNAILRKNSFISSSVNPMIIESKSDGGFTGRTEGVVNNKGETRMSRNMKNNRSNIIKGQLEEMKKKDEECYVNQKEII
jgi:hypothetical protein